MHTLIKSFKSNSRIYNTVGFIHKIPHQYRETGYVYTLTLWLKAEIQYWYTISTQFSEYIDFFIHSFWHIPISPFILFNLWNPCRISCSITLGYTHLTDRQFRYLFISPLSQILTISPFSNSIPFSSYHSLRSLQSSLKENSKMKCKFM